MIKDRKQDEIETHVLKIVGFGFLLAIPTGFIYWLYLASKVLGPIVWYLAIILLIVGVIKLFAAVLGFGVASTASNDSSRNNKPKKSSNYYVQELRAGQWIDLMGHHSLTSAYRDLETRTGNRGRMRVVDRDGNVQ